MGRVLAVSDLHGRYDLWEQVKQFLQPDDILYVLGDCGDRGSKGFEIIQEVYEDERCKYIRGNHEELFADAMRGERMLHNYNGGKKTFDAWKYKYGHDLSWRKKLTDLPVVETYENKQGQKVIMTHAGFTQFAEGTLPQPYELVWDRDHINDSWQMYADKSVIIVHGHTPIPIIGEYLWTAPCEADIEPGVYWYCEDEDGVSHKVDIDCGAFFTGHTTVLNLDTWEEHKFFAEDSYYIDPEKYAW
jgi:predicted phosphodiesterase